MKIPIRRTKKLQKNKIKQMKKKRKDEKQQQIKITFQTQNKMQPKKK
jgi:hypothetical protein